MQKYSFSSKQVLADPNFGIKITELEDFSINNNQENTHHFYGTYFPVKYSIHYGITLMDYIGPYLELKKIYKDLKLIFFKSDIVERFELSNQDLIKYFNSEVIDINLNNYSFDKIILYPIEIPVIPFESYGKDKALDEFEESVRQLRINSIKEVVKEFTQYKSNNHNKNIYVTRSFVNKIHASRKENHNYYKQYRVHDFVYDEELDNIFKTNKYDVIEFFNKTFFEQINISSSANIYICARGSSLLNAIWCHDNTKIILIDLQQQYKEYDFYWTEILNAANKKIYKNIDVSNLNPTDGINYIVKEINNLK